MKTNEIKGGVRVQQIAHPEYGSWIIVEPVPGIAGMWHVRGDRGEKVVDAYELERFWAVL